MNAQSTAKPPRVPPERTLRFATALEDLDAFVEAFSQLVDDRSLFIVTRHPLKVGLICQFVVTLRDGAPVLRGEGEVLESPATLSEASPVTGIRIRVQRLSPSSVELYQRLLERKRLHEISIVESLPTREMSRMPPPPPPKAQAQAQAQPQAAPIVEERAPSSPYILPANPLSELTDRALHGMIECAIHEDYENAPPSDFADLMTPPPGMTRGRRPTTQAAALLPAPEPAPAPVVAPEPIVVTVPPPPPQIIEVPGPPVRISIGVRAQLVTAALAVLVGLGGGFVLFGTDLVWTNVAPRVPSPVVASRSAPPPAAVEPAAAAEPAAAEPAAAVDAGSIAPDPTEPAAEPGPEPAAVADTPTAEPEPPPVIPDGECSLTLHDMHDGATVTVDGVRVRVPASGVVAVACDRELLVSVEHPRYQLFQRKVKATAGSPAVVDINLQRPEAALSIASDPPGALITLDGNVVGRAPTTADTREFTTVHVTATLAGHKVWSKRIRVSKPSMSVSARLEKLPGAP